MWGQLRSATSSLLRSCTREATSDMGFDRPIAGVVPRPGLCRKFAPVWLRRESPTAFF